jgi:ankyrin repeat protein
LEARTFVEDQTPLHYAAKKGYLQIVNFLVRECKADMEARDHQGRTVLYLAAEYGQKEIVEYLIKNNAEIDVVNIYGQRALYWIVAKNPELVGNHIRNNVQK